MSKPVNTASRTIFEQWIVVFSNDEGENALFEHADGGGRYAVSTADAKRYPS